MRRRDRDPDRALPELAELTARGLRSGSSLTVALRTAAREVSLPVAPPLSVALGATDHGVSLVDACRTWLRARPTPPRQMLIAVVELADQLGGRAAYSFDALAQGLRQRDAVRREGRALAAQARLSAAIVGVLPIAVVAILAATDRAILQTALAEPAGRFAIALGLAAQAGGWMWIRRLTRWTRP